MVLGRCHRAANRRYESGLSGVTHLGVAYLWIIAGLAALQVLFILPSLPALWVIGVGDDARPTTDAWYWLSLLTAGTLGTATGDCVAEEFHLGRHTHTDAHF